MKSKLLKALSLCLLLTLLAGLAVPGYAAEKPSIRGTRVLWIGTGKNAVLLDNLPSDARSFKIASSNPAVIKVGKSSNDAFGMWMKPLKVGKAKVTITYKSGGKTRTIAGNYKAKKYPNPFAWIKVDGSALNVKKDLVMSEIPDWEKQTVTVNFKLNSGWKVTGLTGARFKAESTSMFKWKKNKAVKFHDAGTIVLSIELENTKNGDPFAYLIMINQRR